MKKLAILATMFATVTLASCGGDKKEGEGENTDSTAVAADSTVTEPVQDEPAVDTAAAVDTTAAPAEEGK